ncbi:Rho GTPase-activating protein 26-like protein, partial [Leptotrombidium deliense]
MKQDFIGETTRENYDATHDETENLMRKMLETRKTKPQDPGTLNKMYTRQGYLFLMEKKSRRFTMIPYNQTVGKITTTEVITLKECIRRMSDSIDKRFCFDVVASDKQVVYTFQALSDEDRKLWLGAMEFKDPIPLQNSSSSVNAKNLSNSRQEECLLDDLGFAFVRKCIDIIESRGLEDQGLYRVGGVSSRVTRLIQSAFDRKKHSDGEFVFDFDNPDEWEIRTITSALKYYFRNLPEPLMTYRLHQAFITAA